MTFIILAVIADLVEWLRHHSVVVTVIVVTLKCECRCDMGCTAVPSSRHPLRHLWQP